MRKYTKAEKIQALKNLVKEAVAEQRGTFPRGYKYSQTPEFEAAGFQDDNTKILLRALESTDALYILDEILEGVDSGE